MAGGGPRFPGTRSSFGSRLSRADLDFLSEPQGPSLVAHELAHVVQQLHGGLTETPAFAPLLQTAREIYLAWEEEFLVEGSPDQPSHHRMPSSIGVETLSEFFESGVIHPAYAGVVTTPLPDLIVLRDLLLQDPHGPSGI